MTGDNEFKPKLGKIRAQGSKRGRKYLHQVLRAVAFAGGRSSSKRSKFTGTRIGRGAGVGRVLATRDQYAAFRQRRVVIKSRIVKIKAKSGKNGLKAAQVHLRYIQRDGVTREGMPGELYSQTQDRTDGKAFLGRSENDRHQFRFIVSAEDASEYQDLKPFIRTLMTRMEEDLGTKLDWVAVDHFNTGHPHTHLVLRGQDDRGKDLIIARDYMSDGMRERAAEIVSLDFGPRSDSEVENRLRREIEQERFTSLDRTLIKDAGGDGIVSPAQGASVFQQTLRAGRLQKLSRMALADEVAPGRWKLADNLEVVLRDMGTRGDIIKTMNRELTERGRTRAGADFAIYEPASAGARSLTGRIVARGLSDEINDRHYIIVEATDGYAHYVDIGLADATEPMPEGSIVAVKPRAIGPRAADKTVAEIAAANGCRYSQNIHLKHDPSATAEFAEAHVRRLEAIRRTTGGVERALDGTWTIAPDHLQRAQAYEQKQARAVPVTVSTPSRATLESQVGADGATWLDTELVSSSPIPLRDAGFGRDAKAALDRRRMWLMEEGLLDGENRNQQQRSALLATLRRRELTRVGSQLGKELGLEYRPAPQAGRVEGVYRKTTDLVSGKFAVIEGKSKDFTLVPWRPVMERNLGKEISGMIRGQDITWSIGRTRGGPSL